MPRFKKDGEFNFKIHEVYGTIEESDKSNWGIALTKLSWNGNPPVYDIRKFDLGTIDTDNCKMGKGISFRNEESLNNLLYLLLEMGIGNEDKIKKILKNRDKIFEKEKKLIEVVEENF